VATFERPVLDVVDDVLDGGPERLSLFRERIEGDREANSKRFTAFKDEVKAVIEERRWFQSAGALILAAAALLFFLPGALLAFIGIEGFQAVAPRWRDVVVIALGACACINGAILGGAT